MKRSCTGLLAVALAVVALCHTASAARSAFTSSYARSLQGVLAPADSNGDSCLQCSELRNCLTVSTACDQTAVGKYVVKISLARCKVGASGVG